VSSTATATLPANRADILRELAVIETIIARRNNLTPLWTPTAGPQSDAYFSLADELFYGGAGGGGKTDLIIGLATTAHRNSIIFRREYGQFNGKDGIVSRVRDIVGDRGEVLQTLARNIDGLRYIEFGAVQYEHDKNKYKGRPHDLKAFDEITEFSESQYRFLIAWLRTAIVGQRVRVVTTGNPPTDPEGEWVNLYWGPWLNPQHPNPAKPGELRFFAPIGKNGTDVELPNGDPVQNEKGEWINPRSRTFIPARVEDNPYYMATGYADVLDNLPEPLRSRMRFGNFSTVSEDHPWQIIPSAWVKAAQERWAKVSRPNVPLTAVGNDPSRGGGDKFCVAFRYGNWVAEVVKHEGNEAPDGAIGAMLVARDILRQLSLPFDLKLVPRTLPILIDICGAAGSSVFDHVRGLSLRAVAMNGSESSDAMDKSNQLGFFNKRAEWHWAMREALDPNSGQDIALPPDRELFVDLCAPRGVTCQRGASRSKEKTKSRSASAALLMSVRQSSMRSARTRL
jgi:hypothetical protein